MNNELTAALATIEKCREITNCPDGVDLQDWVKQLAAENMGLKKACGGNGSYRNCPACTFSEYIEAPETPATDRIYAGAKADGRVEGINFAAGRLAAAFNHGFVDKPIAEVFDVVRMILTAKEDLAKDPVLAADGLSGEYAEKSLAEWEAALREGAK